MLSVLEPPNVDTLKKQWFRQAAVSVRKAGPCTSCAPQPPEGGILIGQGVGEEEPRGQ